MAIPALWLDHFPASAWGVTVDAKDAGELVKPLRDAYWTLRTEAHRLGLRCEVASGYRTPWQQYELRLGRVPAGHEFDPAEGGSPLTALPGASHHQRREALDLDMTGAGYDWLHDHCHEYGLSLTVPGERWHVEANRPPSVPIIAYPFRTYDQSSEVDMPLSDAELNRIALVTAATVDKVLADNFADIKTALGLPVVAGVDKVLADNFADIRAHVDAVLAAVDHDHGPA